MEKIKIWKNILKWALALNLLVNNANAELINSFSEKAFFQELKKWYNINYFKNRVLESKNAKVNLENKEYFNLNIINDVLDNNYSLEYFLKKYHYFDKISKNKSDIIYIFKSDKLHNKFVYLLYKNKELKVAALTSPWKWKNETPLWKFDTQWKYFAKRSKAFNGYPMPFAVYLDWWIFIHRGKIVDGNPQSHWCFRLRWLSSWINFKNIKYDEKIPVIFTGYDDEF